MKNKVSKKSVNYRAASSQSKRCGTCAMLNPETKRCDLVAGEISPSMVCDKWVRKQ